MGADVFVGRQTELADICGLLGRAGHVTLTGVAGAGKSRLALHLAEPLERESPGYVHVVDLSETPDDILSLAEALAASFDRGSRGRERPDAPGEKHTADARGRSRRSAMETVVNELRGNPGLIVLDGCDRVAYTAGILVDRLLREVRGVRVLVTSRQPLGFPHENVYPIEGLPTRDAVDLLVTLAGDRLGEADPEDLCRRLDNLPLAIEMAAAAPDPASPRHGALHDALSLSYELCGPEERLVWARLSVFSGSFDAEAAQYVCDAGDLGPERVLDALLDLAARSVLSREQDGRGTRYRLLNAVRRYGAIRLDERGESDGTRRRHRDFFLSLAHRAALGWREDQLAWCRRIQPDLANIRLAVEYCYGRPGEAGKGLDLIASLWFLWICCGRHDTGYALLQRGLDLEHEPGPERTRALWVHTWMLIQHGDLEGAERTLAQCTTGTGEWDATAYISHFQAHLAVARGDLAEAMRLIKDARVGHRSAGDLFPGFLPTYVVVATALMLADRNEEAVSVLYEGRELCGSCGDYWTLARLDLLLAQAELSLGNTTAATASVRESLRGARLFDDTIALVEGIETFAVIAENDGDDTFATVLLGAGTVANGTVMAGIRRPPVLAGMLERSEARLRGRTDEKEYGRLIELGRATCLRTAVEHVLRGVVGPGDEAPEDD
ncbi:hypothetical protein GCM10010156_71200 [Planobispora rosea]|uniref:Uncharacterized protein n=1 Tax=Planobispora rosea TaxID=35762 RepID=A0A8J3S471_PLARO|nr:AAA family ATPase [Planobispora rosea]GGT03014.1 hypothetical protein GCM10010156_71200 [Planobispora rosea]GIH86858.1 hypothetical protein Pro02_52660 [Planobispora rosea]